MTGATAVLSGQVFEDVPQRLDLSNQRCPRLRQEQLHSTFPALGRINQSLSQVRKIIETGDGSTNAVRNISRTVSSRIDELSNLSSRLEDFTTESVPDLKKLTLTGVSTNYDAIVEELNSAQNAPSSSDFVCWIVIIGNPDNFSLVSALL
jgi:methyl-accepting chemotaxis protein